MWEWTEALRWIISLRTHTLDNNLRATDQAIIILGSVRPHQRHRYIPVAASPDEVVHVGPDGSRKPPLISCYVVLRFDGALLVTFLLLLRKRIPHLLFLGLEVGEKTLPPDSLGFRIGSLVDLVDILVLEYFAGSGGAAIEKALATRQAVGGLCGARTTRCSGTRAPRYGGARGGSFASLESCNVVLEFGFDALFALLVGVFKPMGSNIPQSIPAVQHPCPRLRPWKAAD